MVDAGHFEDLLEHLERDVLAIDRTGDTAIVHLLFRTVHNLKSSAAQAGLSGLAGELHGLEDAMDRVRRGKAPWTTGCYDQVARVIDLVRQNLRGDRPEPEAPAPRTRAEAAPPPVSSRWGAGLAAAELAACDLADAVGLGLYRIEKLFRRGLDRETFLALPVMEDIRELGKLIAIQPAWEAYDQGPEEQVVKFLFASPRTEEELAQVLFDPLLVLSAPRPQPAAPPKARLRIMTIEDDPTTGLLMHYILKLHGDSVLCQTGAEGLALFRAGLEDGDPFDLVVLDLLLPDLHGDEILREIREEEFRRGIHASGRQRCSVIINTSRGDLDQLMESLKNEPDGYLIKPIDMELLVGKVASLKRDRVTG